MLTRFPLTIDNILTCWSWAQLLQLLKILIIAVRISVHGLLVRQNWNAKHVNTLVRCSRSVAHAFLTTFEQFPQNFGHFGAFWTSAPWSTVNILSIFCYHRHSEVVQAAQIPANIDNILTIDGPSNCCNNIFNFSAHPYLTWGLDRLERRRLERVISHGRCQFGLRLKL